MRHPENPEPSCLRCLFAVTLASGRGESLADGPLLAVLAVAVIAAVAVYAVMVIVTKSVTLEDMKLIPKGDKIAKRLHIR